MNQEDELGTRIAKLLAEGPENLSAEQRERLVRARKLALSRHQAPTAPAWAPAWAGRVSRFTEQSVLGVRYVVPLAALVLGLLGVIYVHTGGVASEIADIDAGLLTDELPIDAYLDQGFDSWLKRSLR
jgi:Protein of unknown function (DUF3619)